MLSPEDLCNDTTPIAHNSVTGRNIIYSLLVTLSDIRDTLPEQYLSTFTTVLSLAVDVFTHPAHHEGWTHLFGALDDFSRQMKK